MQQKLEDNENKLKQIINEAKDDSIELERRIFYIESKLDELAQDDEVKKYI